MYFFDETVVKFYSNITKNNSLILLKLYKRLMSGCPMLYGHRHEKTYLQGFRPARTQVRLLENFNFTYSKFSYDTFQKVNNKGADQTVRMRRLVCTYVVLKPPEFSRVKAHKSV